MKQNIYIGKKRNLSIDEVEEDIKSKIMEKDLNNNKNILFSLTYNEINNILTIHNLQDNIKLMNYHIEEKVFNKEKIYFNNLQKIHDLIEYLEKIEIKIKEIEKKNYPNLKKQLIDVINIKFEKFENFVEFEKYIFSLIDLNCENFSESHLNIILSYLYISMFHTIKIKLLNIIKKGNFEEIFFKFLYSILNKYSQFRLYEEAILKNNYNSIQNFKIYQNNLSFREKFQILSTISTIIFQSPIFKQNSYIEFYMIENKENNIYLKIKNFLFEIIDQCTVKSNIIEGMEMLFSKILIDFNYYNITYNKNVFINQIKNLLDLKKEIKNYFPKIICRYLNSNDENSAFYDILSGLIGINETIYIEKQYNMIYGEYDDIKDLDNINEIVEDKFSKDDEEKKNLYNLYFFKGFWRIIHESYGHQPIQKVNHYSVNTPNHFYFKGSIVIKHDAGNILEYFINKDSSLIQYIKEVNCNINELINVKLFIGNFHEFWKIFEKIVSKIKFEENLEEPYDYYLVQHIYNSYYDDFKLETDKTKFIDFSSLFQFKNEGKIRVKI